MRKLDESQEVDIATCPEICFFDIDFLMRKISPIVRIPI